MRITSQNFLHWYDSAVDPTLPEIPVAYMRDRNACGHMPIALPTEAMSFYINTPYGLNYEDFDNLRLAMYRADGTLVNLSLGPLQSHPIDDHYNIFATLVVPPAERGIHYFTIYRDSTGEELLRSSYVLVRTNTDELYATTTYCRFRNDRFFYNFHYQSVPGFYQQFRLGLSVVDEQVEGDVESYFEVTTGKPRTVQSSEQKLLKLESYYFDRSAHEAAAIMAKHSYLEFNGEIYSLKTAYKSSFNPLQKTYKGELEVYSDSFASINRC